MNRLAVHFGFVAILQLACADVTFTHSGLAQHTGSFAAGLMHPISTLDHLLTLMLLSGYRVYRNSVRRTEDAIGLVP